MHKLVDTLTHPISTFTATAGINAVTPTNDIWDIVIKVATTVISLIPLLKGLFQKKQK